MKSDAELFYFATAFFPKRVFVFGDWHDSHLAGRWISKRNTSEILDFARKVSEAGGLIYLDNQKYRYLVNPNTGPQILVDGWSEAQAARREFELAQAGTSGARNERSEAAPRRVPEGQKDFTCLVTRKVSPEIRTRIGKVSLTDETNAGMRS